MFTFITSMFVSAGLLTAPLMAQNGTTDTRDANGSVGDDTSKPARSTAHKAGHKGKSQKNAHKAHKTKR